MNKIKRDISIIMPCYNTKPVYLQEAIDSVRQYKGEFDYEIVVIDDGSTDAETIELLNRLKSEDLKIIHQENKGPSAARNNGVEQCNSNYVLCLDSDNKMKPEYIDAGIKALNEDSKVAVVYSKPKFIGESNQRNFISSSFNIERLLVENYIDMCSVIRKQAWNDAGGLDENLKQHEDWEFWLRLYKAGWKFIFINKYMFEYRVRSGSLITQAGENGYKNIIEYMYKKHWELLHKVYYTLYATSIIYKEDTQHPFRSFIKYLKRRHLNQSKL